jgi:hypothetical protein
VQFGVKADREGTQAEPEEMRGVFRPSLARISNRGFLRFCTAGAFRDYIVDHSLNEAARRIDRSIAVDRQVRVHVALKNGSFGSRPEIQSAGAKFMSERAREKIRYKFGAFVFLLHG